MSFISLNRSINLIKRKAGYVKDQKGIIRRYSREADNWLSHIENCKQFIVANLQKTGAKKVAILGSGYLLDVPIDELIENNFEVDFYDINHPLIIKRKYNSVKGFNFITKDLTHGLIEKAVKCKSYIEFVQLISEHKITSLNSNYDYVISLNLLNQLDILLCDYIIKKFRKSNEDLIEIRTQIQEQHLQLLQKYKSCLITDSVEQQLIDNKIQCSINLIFCSLKDLECQKEWEWIFDTNRSFNENYNTSFIVKAFTF